MRDYRYILLLFTAWVGEGGGERNPSATPPSVLTLTYICGSTCGRNKHSVAYFDRITVFKLRTSITGGVHTCCVNS